MWEKHYTPPPPNHPHIWDTKSEQGDIDSNCPIYYFNICFVNVENSIKRVMRKNCFSKKKNIFVHQFFF